MQPKINFTIEDDALETVKKFAGNGREAVSIIQTAAGLVETAQKSTIAASDIEWVINSCQLGPSGKIFQRAQVGVVNGLAVWDSNMGMLVELEVNALRSKHRTT